MSNSNENTNTKTDVENWRLKLAQLREKLNLEVAAEEHSGNDVPVGEANENLGTQLPTTSSGSSNADNAKNTSTPHIQPTLVPTNNHNLSRATKSVPSLPGRTVGTVKRKENSGLLKPTPDHNEKDNRARSQISQATTTTTATGDQSLVHTTVTDNLNDFLFSKNNDSLSLPTRPCSSTFGRSVDASRGNLSISQLLQGPPMSLKKPNKTTSMSTITPGSTTQNKSRTTTNEFENRKRHEDLNANEKQAQLPIPMASPSTDVTKDKNVNKSTRKEMRRARPNPKKEPVIELREQQQTKPSRMDPNPVAQSNQQVELQSASVAHVQTKFSRMEPNPVAQVQEQPVPVAQSKAQVELKHVPVALVQMAQVESKPSTLHREMEIQKPPLPPTNTRATPSLPLPQIANTEMYKDNTMIFVNGKGYQLLNLLGKGGSSKVWQVYDPRLEKCLALKVVDLAGTEEVVRNAYENEIALLKRLQYSDRIIRLVDTEKRRDEQFVVMERGDTDLGKYLKTKQAKKEDIPDSLIESYFREMLLAVSVIHKEGIIHSDLKPANFLLVGGCVKLIDFGIASTLTDNKTSVTIECQMGTVNYMSPEAIRNSGSLVASKEKRVTTKSDIWSLGCILYSMVYGRTPYQHLTNQYQKMMAIMGEDATKGRIHFPERYNKALVDVMKLCLKREPKDRCSAEELLKHPYFKDKKDSSSKVNELQLMDLAAQLGTSSPNTRVKILKRAFDFQTM